MKWPLVLESLLTHTAANKHPYKIEHLLSVKAVTLISISGRGSAIPSAKQGKSG